MFNHNVYAFEFGEGSNSEYPNVRQTLDIINAAALACYALQVSGECLLEALALVHVTVMCSPPFKHMHA